MNEDIEIPADLTTRQAKEEWHKNLRSFSPKSRRDAFLIAVRMAHDFFREGVLDNKKSVCATDRVTFFSYMNAAAMALTFVVRDMSLPVRPDEAEGFDPVAGMEECLGIIVKREKASADWTNAILFVQNISQHNRFEAFMRGLAGSYATTGSNQLFEQQWAASFKPSHPEIDQTPPDWEPA